MSFEIGEPNEKGWRRLLASRGVRTALLFAIVVALDYAGLFAPLDGRLADLRFRYITRPASQTLTIVGLDPDSLHQFGQWPLPRSAYATAIRNLVSAGAKLIAFDVDFSARSTYQEDKAFDKAISDADGKVILPTFVQLASINGSTFKENSPSRAVSNGAVFASANLLPEESGIVRKGTYGYEVDGVYRQSLAGALAGAPYGDSGTFLIDYGIRANTIPTISFKDAYSDTFDPSLVRNRVILIGATAVELGDEFAVPTGGLESGVFIHGLAYESLHQDRALFAPSRAVRLGLALLSLLMLNVYVSKWRFWRVAIPHVTVLGAAISLPYAVQSFAPVNLDVAPIFGAQILQLICAVVTELRRRAKAIIFEREQKILHLAMHDPETELPNRRALIRDLQACLASDSNAPLYVVAIEIERFSVLRGAIGYQAANELIKALSRQFASVTANRRVVRISTSILGLVFVPDESETIDRLAAALQEVAEEPLHIGAATVDVAVTSGIAIRGTDGDNAELLVERALIAIDQAGLHGHKSAFFDLAAYGDPANNLSLMSEMLLGLGNGEIRLFYQPKLDLRSNRVVSVEALIRWFHPERGFIRPDIFIGMAEQTGHIRQVTDWVLRRAVTDYKAALARGYNLTFSINVSGRQIDDDDFAAKAKAFLIENPANICFEVTETGIIDNPEKALSVMEDLRSLGVKFSIDDYGTGLSSLSYLKRIPADELKIDKSFVETLANSQRDVLLIRSTIELAHNLGMTVVAEGIEDEETLATLGLMGCDVIQGYFISKPIPFSELIDFLKGRESAAAIVSSPDTDTVTDIHTVSTSRTA